MIQAEVEAEQTQPERSGDVEATQYMKQELPEANHRARRSAQGKT